VPDGGPLFERMAFVDSSKGPWAIYIADATGARRYVARGQSPSWSPDGQWIAIEVGGDIAAVRPDGSDRLLADIGSPREAHWRRDDGAVLLGSRCIDLVSDRDFVLDLKVLTNYASDSRVARAESLADYSRRWYAGGQPEQFWVDLSESLEDARTIASIFDLGGEDLAWAWVTFSEFDGYEFVAAELRELAVAPARRRRGVGGEVLRFVEETARARGATVLRSEVGVDNEASLRMHARCGLLPAGITFEKHLTLDRQEMERDWRYASVASLRDLAGAVEDPGGPG